MSQELIKQILSDIPKVLHAQENIHEVQELTPKNTKKALVETKVLVDRWDNVTTMLIINPNNAHHIHNIEEVITSGGLKSLSSDQMMEYYYLLTKCETLEDREMLKSEIPPERIVSISKFGNQPHIWGADFIYTNLIPENMIIACDTAKYEICSNLNDKIRTIGIMKILK